ncbi:hypothetical protein F5Y12DRAFT_792640 [Xylaria sp. FL1777]|nr:hypothetical protein F5Y12DRAFT_792640 [Xylaria sp. FL1777]
MFALLTFTATWLLALALSHPLLDTKPSCPPFGNGTINIASYQLYPENVDFDEQSCLLCKFAEYEINHDKFRKKPSQCSQQIMNDTSTNKQPDIGALYNASVVVYDPYKASIVSTIEFPNITRTLPFHIGGVAWDPYAGSRSRNKSADEITILVDAAPAHETAGRNISGDNYLIRYSARTHRVLWRANLTAQSAGRYGGPQDVEHDTRGNVYVLGTYPGTIQRVSGAGGAVEEWFVPPAPIDHAVLGYTGLAAVDGSTLLVADARNGSAEGGALYRFDMSALRGVPTRVPVAYPAGENEGGSEQVIRPGDAIYLPPKYGGAVLLIAEHGAGVSVLRSEGKGKRNNEWRAAEFLGRIPNPPEITASGGLVTAAVEIAGSVFLVEEWFTDPLIPGTSAGNRTSFPLVDVTAQLDALVNAN